MTSLTTPRSRPDPRPRRDDVQIFEPLTIHSSPSRTARVLSEARSLPASGSLKSWHQISSPERSFGR
jgi:hypothetical protein